jgi:hypothetical protein
MPHPPKIFVQPAIALLLATLFAFSSSRVATARGGGGGHGFGGAGLHDVHFAGHGRHGNDSYIKAASEEREKLLTKLKDICRGC